MKDVNKRERSNYLFACGLGLVSAAFALVTMEEVPQGLSRGSVLLVAVASLALFAFVSYRASIEQDGGMSCGRRRKMTFLWLALALITGAGMVRSPVAHGISGNLDLSSREVAAAIVGVAVVVLSAFRGVVGYRLWREKKRRGLG